MCLRPNGHKVEVSPLKRVLLRAVPELSSELEHVRNAFDSWARKRGDFYSLEWEPREGAEDDEAFAEASDATLLDGARKSSLARRSQAADNR